VVYCRDFTGLVRVREVRSANLRAPTETSWLGLKPSHEAYKSKTLLLKTSRFFLLSATKKRCSCLSGNKAPLCGNNDPRGDLIARSPKISQAFQGMILEKRAVGLSVHTISDYQNTLKKVLLYFPGDPQIATITQDQLVQFFAWLRDDYISRPGGVARRKPCSLSAKSRLNIHTNLSALWT
jgi:hypothetical protein